MRALNLSLADILQSAVQYRIPIYQRRYEWGKEQYEVLWEDLLDTFSRRKKEGAGAYSHFFGVVVRRDEDSDGVLKYYDLIDGQQRLTTASLLVKAVRDAYQEYIDHAGGSVNACIHAADALLFNTCEPAAADVRLKLLPSQLDRGAFKGIMGLGQEPGPVESPMQQAYRFFRRRFEDEIEGIPEDAIGTKANDLISTMVEGFAAAVVTLGGEDNDYQVFESLNGKGFPLSESDKIRNFCFMHVSALDEKEINALYNGHWFPMEHALERASVSGGGRMEARNRQRDGLTWVGYPTTFTPCQP